MIKITVLFSLLLLPLTSLGQETPGNSHCDIKPLSSEASNAPQISEIEQLKKQLEQEFDKRNYVIICFHQLYVSPDHGIFGLFDWDEQNIAEIEISKFTDGVSPVGYTVFGQGFTVQKAPLGTWHVKGDEPKSIWQDAIASNDLNDVLLGVKSNLLKSDRNFSAEILAVGLAED